MSGADNRRRCPPERWSSISEAIYGVIYPYNLPITDAVSQREKSALFRRGEAGSVTMADAPRPSRGCVGADQYQRGCG